MRAFGLAVVAATMFGAAAVAADGRFERSLKMLAPEERLEQLCDYTAMTRIRTEAKQYRPDRAVANAMAEPKTSGNTLEVDRRRIPQPEEMVRAVLPLHGDARPHERGGIPFHDR